ncbi:hypothetical protein PV797_10180 [Clostridiaceae bacterium M8S5]|nr:hypothetical protein PV797_10180 [Clostridiaceae bacterium M8S5]
MFEIIKLVGSIIIVMVLVELLDLPDWIGEKLRGKKSNKEMSREVSKLADQIRKLEEEVKRMH